ncbi:hypothetical protein GCM10027046_02560 [Uliginosibacterium flavum]|uniref:Uncharacterized protein n=1 Tax=Uliginosibacterium flavum TaxID=1396831 RepID=A0ABV2THR8_9RHOO
MNLLSSILTLENRSNDGERTLGSALELAVAEWGSGSCDRELRLHLAFLSWYCMLEPPHLTGFDETLAPFADLPGLFVEVYTTFEQGILDDPECLYAFGLMATLSPWLLGENEATWKTRSTAFRTRYRQLCPDGLNPVVFNGRGAYGAYFRHQLKTPGGF